MINMLINHLRHNIGVLRIWIFMELLPLALLDIRTTQAHGRRPVSEIGEPDVSNLLLSAQPNILFCESNYMTRYPFLP